MLTVGRFAIAGAWDDAATPPGLTRLVMVPSFAFSNGWSPHTQAGLAGLEAHLQPGMTFLDVGTGSGILAIAACKLGAAQVWATDVQPEALDAARANFAANAVDVTLVEGSFIDTHVDLAVISISTRWAADARADVHADTIIVVHDDCSWEVVP
jgi:ribosomal protein L11 methyltransferase